MAVRAADKKLVEYTEAAVATDNISDLDSTNCTHSNTANEISKNDKHNNVDDSASTDCPKTGERGREAQVQQQDLCTASGKSRNFVIDKVVDHTDPDIAINSPSSSSLKPASCDVLAALETSGPKPEPGPVMRAAAQPAMITGIQMKKYVSIYLLSVICAA